MTNKTNSNAIRYWSSDDQPREKMIAYGKQYLSNAELVAILLGSGSKSESAVGLAQRILNTVHNDLDRLSKLTIPELKQFKGIGEAKAVSIVAALELGKRKRLQAEPEVTKITSSASAFQLLQPVLGELPHEEFWILFLNNANVVLQKSQLSKGGITGTLVDVRLVLKQALTMGAVGLILAHNHPSGTLKVSEADKAITKKLSVAAATLDIKVLDHLIITTSKYFSFADEGLM